MGERRIAGVHGDHGEHGRHRDLRRQQVPEFLLDQVAEHAPGARVQDVQRIRFGARMRLGWPGQQAGLRAVAVHHHYVVLGGQRGDRLRRAPDVRLLDLSGHRARAPSQRLAAQGDYDPHELPPRPVSISRGRPGGITPRG
jgi:hypothetical protein